MTLFKDHDADDDWIYVDTAPEVAGLFVKTDPGGAYLTPGKANELHAALGRWLSESGVTAQLATAPPVAPLTPSGVVQMIRDEVARAIPLHLAPTVTGPRCGVCGGPWNDGHGQPGDPCRAQQAPETLCHRPRPADAHAAARCTWCGHLWTEHPVVEPEPQHTGPNAAAADREYGRLMSQLPKRRTAKCINCEHPQSLHSGVKGRCTSLVDVGDGRAVRTCGCDWSGK